MYYKRIGDWYTETLECFVRAAVVGVEVCYSINYLRVEVYILKSFTQDSFLVAQYQLLSRLSLSPSELKPYFLETHSLQPKYSLGSDGGGL